MREGAMADRRRGSAQGEREARRDRERESMCV